MRPLIIAFLILAPFIALAQNYHLHVVPSLTQAPVGHLARAAVTTASMKMAGMMHEVQQLLS